MSGLKEKVIIAVDGPTAAGKGTVSRLLAKKLGFSYFDTGLLYRCVARRLVECGDGFDDEKKACHEAKKISLFSCQESPSLRTEDVSRVASGVAEFKSVRDALVQVQRQAPEQMPMAIKGIVVDGRDIGTVIFPKAPVKFFITASESTRAERRWKELQNKGESCTMSDVLTALQIRDRRDSERVVSPLTAAEDAVIIDTTGLSPAEVVDKMLLYARQKMVV